MGSLATRSFVHLFEHNAFPGFLSERYRERAERSRNSGAEHAGQQRITSAKTADIVHQDGC